ncbi:mannosylglycoprotein endo-beta-mannosidase [Quercus suber]|uniref:Mannosylglycoprotein endo-beta-mannosidase n=1 Tax=Quercus suber TaxID=58331 RepID=A0AAW0JCL4_QUESU
MILDPMLFKVNGQPIIIHGGNWILSDGLLRLLKERYETDIKFHADMHLIWFAVGVVDWLRGQNFTIIVIFMTSGVQEFWSTEEIEMVTRDTVNLLRNHPSLALSVGENKQVPLDDINKDLENVLRLNPYFENSNEISKSSEDLSVASKDPSQYLDVHVFTSKDLCGMDLQIHGFNPEVDSVRMAVAYTIRARMSQEG